MPLQLHDVDDVARFVRAIVSRSGLELSWSDREDLEQTLQIVAWEISLKFEPGGVTFSTYANTILKRRVVDWQRSKLGRTRWQFKGRVHIRELPSIVPFDDSARDRLEQSLAERDGDREASGDLSFIGLDGGGDWQRARDAELLGCKSPRRATN